MGGGPYPFKAAAFASLDLHVQVANDVSSSSAKGIHNQQELQQLAATIAGQLPFFFSLSRPPSNHFDQFLNDGGGKNIWSKVIQLCEYYYMCNRKLIA